MKAGSVPAFLCVGMVLVEPGTPTRWTVERRLESDWILLRHGDSRWSTKAATCEGWKLAHDFVALEGDA